MNGSKYVAFGTDCFCRFKFQPVRNAEEYSTLPAETILQDGSKLPGGLIGYPIGVKNGVASDEAWDETFEMMGERSGEKMFSFRLKKSEVFYLNTFTIIQAYSILPHNGQIFLDFTKLSKYKVIYIYRGLININPFRCFDGWEIHDTILVMDPSIVIARKS